jgi:hypothetical protein
MKVKGIVFSPLSLFKKNINRLMRRWDSAVGMATGYGLDDQGVGG